MTRAHVLTSRFRCATCGSHDFSKPGDGELQPTDVLNCVGCGKTFPAQPLFEATLDLGAEAIRQALGLEPPKQR